MRRAAILLIPLLALGVLAGFAPRSATSASSATSAADTTCAPTDQDRYVYDPTRLDVVRACVHVSGVVDTVESDVDGDVVIHLRLDAAYRDLLRPANDSEEHGDLVVEAVCVGQPVQPNAVLLCDADPAPYAGPLPQPGQHLWLEGRYVFDGHHEGHAELHPLYRAGSLAS